MMSVQPSKVGKLYRKIEIGHAWIHATPECGYGNADWLGWVAPGECVLILERVGGSNVFKALTPRKVGWIRADRDTWELVDNNVDPS